MNMNVDLTKEILEDVAEKCDGFTPNTICRSDYTDNHEKFDALVAHHKILLDDGLIDCEFVPINCQGVPVVFDIIRKGITSKGRSVLKKL